MKITDPHNGKQKFFKGRGRSGSKKMDDYQKMLMEPIDPNEPKQKPLTKKQLRERGYITKR